MPSLILAIVWVAIASIVELRKKTSRWIPFSLIGISYCNTLLCTIELALYSAYNMNTIFYNVLFAGIVVPSILSSLFIFAWFLKFRHDLSVKTHYKNYKKTHIFALISILFADYRSWKLLYSMISRNTALLAFKLQFKFYNRGWSFACLISDCFLAVAGVAAFSKGRADNLPVVIVVSIERLIISGSMIALTVTEWAFKSKISREDKMRVYSANLGHDEERRTASDSQNSFNSQVRLADVTAVDTTTME